MPNGLMLSNKPTSKLFPYVTSRDSQGQLWPKETLRRTTPHESVSDFITPYFGMSGDPEEPHHMLGRDIIQPLLTLMY
jgi:hypothetical protein